MDFQPLTLENLEAVYELYKKNELFYSIPFQSFQWGTIEDEDFDPNLTLVLKDSNTNQIIASLIAVNRAGNCCIKAFIIDNLFRRQGIGQKMLNEIIVRIKNMDEKITSMNFGASPPNYWLTGVDLRHTDLFFFLKKNGFRPKELRQNLTVDLRNMDLKPCSEKKEYLFERVQSKDFEGTINFVKENYGHGSWPDEVKISLKSIPPSTFIAKNKKGEIVGWATHSFQFPGAFGPTGVLVSLQGQGIGTELLKWCLWDIKQKGIDISMIIWVVGDTIKFYSKSIGAYIYPLYYDMVKKIRK